MAKASPLVRSMNGGEFSALMEGRTDVERYPSSMRRMVNFIAAPQGPALARSGTMFVVNRAKNTEYSALVPFVPQDQQAKLLEITEDRIRFIDEDGLQVYSEDDMTVDVGQDVGSPIVFNSSELYSQIQAVIDGGAEPDPLPYQIVFSGFPNDYGLNGVVANLQGSLSSTFTTDINWPNKAVVSGKVSLVYAVYRTVTLEERQNITYVQSVDVLYLLTGKRPLKLSRRDTYDWLIENVTFVDGPFMSTNDTPTSLKPNGTGNAVLDMDDNTESFGVASGSSKRAEVSGTLDTPDKYIGREITYHLNATDYYMAFSGGALYWASNEAQTGTIQFDPTGGFTCDGYSITIPSDNDDPSYTAKDHAPVKWRFEGKTGGVWELIDQRDDYVLWDNHKSVFFEIQDPMLYSAYRLVIQKLMRNGRIEPRISRFVMRSTDSASFDMTASSETGINNDTGFAATDVGRLIRLKGSDNTWRTVEILTVTDSTHISVELKGDPLPNTTRITQWQLGYWSNTTGWPTVGAFIDDRLWLCSSDEAPDMFAASVVGDYENFQSSDVDGTVLDDSAIVLRLNSRKQARIRWVSADDKSVIMGTGAEEYLITAASSSAGMSAKNFKARRVSDRGSANVQPERVDNQIIYVQKSGRNVREFTYTFETDGYKSPSMTQLSSHMGQSKFVEVSYAAEPHSLMWFRREDGTIVGMTYNREENVVGWHRHDFGGEIINTAILPSQDSEQDVLWLQIKRVIGGEDQYYIERLMPFWDFHFTIDDAHFVDCGLAYDGDPLQVLYGLEHLEGKEVYGLADGRPFGPLVVTEGAIDLGDEYSKVVVGLGYEAEAETSRLENGAADGTALGKVKRINNVTFFLWASAGGQYGTYNQELGEIVYTELEYETPLDDLEVIELFTGKVGPVSTDPDYNERGSIAFRKRKQDTLPFNVVAIAPQLNTQDR